MASASSSASIVSYRLERVRRGSACLAMDGYRRRLVGGIVLAARRLLRLILSDGDRRESASNLDGGEQLVMVGIFEMNECKL